MRRGKALVALLLAVAAILVAPHPGADASPRLGATLSSHGDRAALKRGVEPRLRGGDPSVPQDPSAPIRDRLGSVDDASNDADEAQDGDGGGFPWPWEWPGAIKDAFFSTIGDAINSWFKSIVEAALEPIFELFAQTVFETPDLTSQPRLVALWKVSLGLADAALILFAVVAGGVVMTGGGLSARLTAKEVLPRLVVAALAANFSLLVVDQTTRLFNSVALAVVGIGGDARSVSQQMAELVSGAFTNPFLALLGLVVVVIGLLVVAVFVLRIAALVVLVAGAPLMLVCHALPHTESLARLWWRGVMAALAVPVAQALVLAVALRVVLSSQLIGLSASGLVDLVVVSCLLYLMYKIPLLAANATKAGVGTRAWHHTKTVIVRTARSAAAA